MASSSKNYACCIRNSASCGQPTEIQARSSSRRQRSERPMQTGRGTRPLERQVRSETAHIVAACVAVTRKESFSDIRKTLVLKLK